MKTKTMQVTVLMVIIGMLLSGVTVFFALGGGSASTITGNAILDDQGNVVDPWASKVVDYQLITSDKFVGTNLNATAKVYDVKPVDWGNPRGTFTDGSLYTTYLGADGVVTINKENPGHYYVVLTYSGYNTEFVEIDVPTGIGRGDLSEYNAEPDRTVAEMSLVGSTTDVDFALTLVNDTDASVRATVTLTVAENTELRGWKAVITDTEGFSVDTDNDGTFDEGLSVFKLSIAGEETVLFDSNKQINLFEEDTADKVTLDLSDLVVADNNDVVIKIDITADTGDYTGANDEVWGEGEGILGYVYIYDAQGSLFSTTDITA